MKGITQQEVSALTKAMKTQEFQKHMDDYISEISDPAHRPEYEQYLDQIEAKGEMPEGMQLLRCEPGLCVKTNIRFKNGQDQKCFINIVHSNRVEEMQLTADPSRGGTSVHLPYSLSPPRPDRDKKGEYCMTCDMAVSTGTFMRCSQPEYLKMIVDTASQGLTENFLKGHEEVKNDYKVLQNVKCKGGKPLPMSVNASLLKDKGKAHKKSKRKTGKDDVVTPAELAEMRKDAKALREKQDAAMAHVSDEEDSEEERKEKLRKERKQEEEEKGKAPRIRVPKHKLVHSGTIDLTDFMESENRPMTVRNLPKLLKLDVELPTVKRIEAITLEVTKQNVVVEVADKYYLDLPLSYEIDDSKGSAAFDKTKQVLSLTLPVVPKFVESVVSDLQEDGDGHITEDEEGAISEHGSENDELPPLEESQAKSPANGNTETPVAGKPEAKGPESPSSQKKPTSPSAKPESPSVKKTVQHSTLNDSDFVKDGNLKVVDEPTAPAPDGGPLMAEELEEFVPSDKYDGSRPGYFFSMGEKGLGYYRDRRQKRKFADPDEDRTADKSPDILYQRQKKVDEEITQQSSDPMVVEVSSAMVVQQNMPSAPTDSRSLWSKGLLQLAEQEALLQSRVASTQSEDAPEEPAFQWMENLQNLRLIFTLGSSQDVADIRLVQNGLRLAVSYCMRPCGSAEGAHWVRYRLRRALTRAIDLQQWHAELRPEQSKCLLMVIVRKRDQEIWGDAFEKVEEGETWDDLDVHQEDTQDGGDGDQEDTAGDAPIRSEGLVDSAELDIAEPEQRKEASTSATSNKHILAAGVVPAGGMTSQAAAAASQAVQSAAVMGMAVLLKNKLIYTLV